MRSKHSLYSYALGMLLETLEGLFAKKFWQCSRMAGQVIREGKRRGLCGTESSIVCKTQVSM